jgi:ribosome-associated protein
MYNGMNNTSNTLVDTIIEALQDKKGKRIVIADLSSIPEAACQKFIICTGGSPAQVQALADNVIDETRNKLRIRPLAIDGMRHAMWVAMDYAEAIVHIFLPEEREFYDIEHLWADADLTEIPDID